MKLIISLQDKTVQEIKEHAKNNFRTISATIELAIVKLIQNESK